MARKRVLPMICVAQIPIAGVGGTIILVIPIPVSRPVFASRTFENWRPVLVRFLLVIIHLLKICIVRFLAIV